MRNEWGIAWGVWLYIRRHNALNLLGFHMRGYSGTDRGRQINSGDNSVLAPVSLLVADYPHVRKCTLISESTLPVTLPFFFSFLLLGARRSALKYRG